MNCRICNKKINDREVNLCQLCFIDTEKPSKNDELAWLYVYSEQEKTALESIVESDEEHCGFKIELNKIIKMASNGSKEEWELTEENMDKVAINRLITSGKWLIFEHEFDIDHIWKKIATATINGELGGASKVSTALQSSKTKRYVICVYTDNYLDIDDVMRVRNKLKEIGFNKKLAYKPDIYTLLGIYQGTTSLSPTRYRA